MSEAGKRQSIGKAEAQEKNRVSPYLAIPCGR
jgi:hypothetical protein